MIQEIIVNPSSTPQKVTVTIPDNLPVKIEGGTPIPDPEPPNEPPTANAGMDIEITLPLNAVLLSGVAKDADGTINSVKWTQTKGTGAFIEDPTLQSTMVSNLQEGINEFTFEVSDDGGLKKMDAVLVTVKPKPIEPAPQQIFGFGSRATGGTGKQIINVDATNFASSLGNDRILRFKSDSIIKKNFSLGYSNLTIDGNGFNVVFDGSGTSNWENGLSISGKNIIVKNISSVNWHNDNINVVGGQDIVIYRCFAIGAKDDGNIDIASGSYITVQECIMAGKSKNGNQLITANYVSCIGNLYTGDERNAMCHGNYSTAFFDFRNNLVYNWEGFGTCCFANARGNVVNNFYQSTSNPGNAVDNLDGWNGTQWGKGRLYAAGNVSGNSGVNPNADSNSTEHAVADFAKLPMVDARTGAQKILAIKWANPTAQSIINSVVLK